MRGTAGCGCVSAIRGEKFTQRGGHGRVILQGSEVGWGTEMFWGKRHSAYTHKPMCVCVRALTSPPFTACDPRSTSRTVGRRKPPTAGQTGRRRRAWTGRRGCRPGRRRGDGGCRPTGPPGQRPCTGRSPGRPRTRRPGWQPAFFLVCVGMNGGRVRGKRRGRFFFSSFRSCISSSRAPPAGTLPSRARDISSTLKNKAKRTSPARLAARNKPQKAAAWPRTRSAAVRAGAGGSSAPWASAPASASLTGTPPLPLIGAATGSGTSATSGPGCGKEGKALL